MNDTDTYTLNTTPKPSSLHAAAVTVTVDTGRMENAPVRYVLVTVVHEPRPVTFLPAEEVGAQAWMQARRKDPALSTHSGSLHVATLTL